MLDIKYIFYSSIVALLFVLCLFGCGQETDKSNEDSVSYPELTVEDVDAVIEESQETIVKEGKLIYIMKSEYGGWRARVNFGKLDHLEFEVTEKPLVDEMENWISRVVRLEYYETMNEETRKSLLFKNYRATNCTFVHR